MNLSAVSVLSGVASGIPSRAWLEPRWYAAHTRARHEKSVARLLESRSIDFFLPLYEKMSRWKDRTVRLQLPLFSGYVFVRVALADQRRVLEIPGIARLVGFGGQPSDVPDIEIESLRSGLSGLRRAEPCPYLAVGRRVRLKFGALRGLEGILVKKKSSLRFVISMDLIQRSIAVEVDAADVDAA